MIHTVALNIDITPFPWIVPLRKFKNLSAKCFDIVFHGIPIKVRYIEVDMKSCSKII